MSVTAARRPRFAGHVAVLCLVFAYALAAADASVPQLLGGGGIDRNELAHDEIPAFARANLELELWRSAERLRADGKLAPADHTTRVSGLTWPLRARSAYADADYHGISNFVDLNPAFPNQLLDYTCAARSYDQATGYNHAGIDYFLWPFGWRMMDAGVIDVIAAAPGTIIHKVDGYDDRSCTNNYSPSWNAVYVQHGDGTVAWYGHMKVGSLTSKPVGASVVAGEALGLVASSGFSSGPHLHFELRGSNAPGAPIFEPHSGTCRSGASLWAVQRPYWDSGINKLATHSAPPQFAVSCPNPGQETPNFRNNFNPGVEPLIVAAYYRDQLQGELATYRLRRGGTVATEWQHASDTTYAASYWYWSFTPLPASTARGVWIFEVDFRGRTYRHEYTVGSDIIFATAFGG